MTAVGKRAGGGKLVATLAVGVLMFCAGVVFIAGPATASEQVTGTSSNISVSASVVESDAPDPSSDQLGWEHGVWANATLAIDQSDGITEAELEAVVARTMARVEAVRGIEFERTPPVRILLPREQQSESETRTYSDAERTLLNQQYEALFLINESRDAVASQRALLGGAVNGYYSPETGNVTMVSPDSSVRQIREGVLAQELFHAQQDTQFDLPAVETIEQRNTRNSYVEGDANYVQNLYEKRCEGNWHGTCYRPERDSLPDLSGLNSGMFDLFQQPYQSGYEFVRDRHQQAGWEAVTSLYEQPPASTEQVIHPEKYGADRPSDLQVSDMSTEAWQPLRVDGARVTGSVGEAGLYVSLLYPATQTAGQAEIIPLDNHRVGGFGDPVSSNYAHPATEGWDGDRLVPYTAASGDATGYVYETVWDTSADAGQFHRAYRKLLAYHDADPVPGLANTYRIPERDGFTDAFYVNRTADRVRIINAPTVQALSGIRSGAAPESDRSEQAPPWERADLAWDTALDARGLSSPTASAGTLYVGGPSAVYAVDEETGGQAWTQSVEGAVTSAPTVSAGSVYAGTLESGVVATNATTGTQQWRRQVSGAVVHSPTVSGDTVYVGTAAGRLHALHGDTGEQVWSHPTNGTVVGQPVVVDDAVLAVDRTGVSSVNTTNGDPEWRVTVDGRVLSQPTVSGDTVYITTSDASTGKSRIQAIETDTGEVRWSHATNGVTVRPLTAANGTVYAGELDLESSTTTLLALAGDGGDVQWERRLNGTARTSPVVSNDTVYVGTSTGRVSAVGATSGDRRWVVSTDGSVNAPLLVANATLYAGSRSGTLLALDTPTGATRWTLPANGLASISPVLADDTVYANAGTTLYAVAGSAKADSDDAPDGAASGDGGDGSGQPSDGATDDGDPDRNPDADPSTDDQNDSGSSTVDQGTDNTPAASDEGPGFGVLAAVIATVAAAGVSRIRRQS
jgi:outer membrane protein assembly factor BamB